MGMRGYKLQEFVAHSTGVNCLNIGKKSCRLFVTGGEDHKVNLWAIGKPISLMSLCGHTTPVESIVFDSAETLVLAGASSGAIKLWDLEEVKMVRTLTGHRSNCSAVEFHPFGEFFASGSLDTNLKIWDIRKKECIHTYMGHTGGIHSIRFTPDGRWVVSGGFDNVVKVWDLTAGKPLHDFKCHEGPIRSIDFHPLEFLLATGSADRTIKFWDLESFELIGSSRPEANGVRSITFHPDGKTLLCGLDDSLKVYSWEPVICHDAIEMGWSTLGDLCFHEGKLLGCSYYRNSVGVWVADISFIDPFGSALVPEQTSSKAGIFNLKERQPFEKIGGGPETNDLRCISPEPETIKNIYVDSSGGKPVAVQMAGSQTSSKVTPPLDYKEMNSKRNQTPSLDYKEISSKTNPKRSLTTVTPAKSSGQPIRRSFAVPNVVPRDSLEGKTSTNFRRESIRTVGADSGVLDKSSYRRSSNRENEGLSMPAEPRSDCNMTGDLGSGLDAKFQTRLVIEDDDKNVFQEKVSTSGNVAKKFPETAHDRETYNESHGFSNLTHPAKPLIGVVLGRTRSLVDKFERRESGGDDQLQVKTSPPVKGPQICERESTPLDHDDVSVDLMQSHDEFLSTLRSRLTKLQVMHHYWERNDIKGSINAMKKLPDHSVQADLISVLNEKMDILTLDLFSCLLPVLASLLGSKMERHANVSLEMLLKLVAVFGTTVQSTISAPQPVGVDLHAERRLECCKQCSMELQKVHKILPALIKRDGVVAKCAQELDLLLQDS